MHGFTHDKIINAIKHKCHFFLRLAGKLYTQISEQQRGLFAILVYYQLILWIIHKLRLKIWVVHGKEFDNQIPMSILYATRGITNEETINKNYILELMFGKCHQESYLGNVWLWNIRKVIKEKGRKCTFCVLQMDESLVKFLRQKSLFYIPNWVVGVVNIEGDPKLKKDSSLKSDLRRIRKQKLQFEVTQNPKKFDDFYYNMYLPHITKSHGSSALILSYDVMKTAYDQWELLIVKKDEMPIAGIIIAYGHMPCLREMGVRDSNPQYIKDGAVGALFYYSTLYLKRKQFTNVHFGWSRAFLVDGVLQYKKKWSLQIIGASTYGYALKIINYNSAAKYFLQENPFIFKNRDLFKAAIFMKNDVAFLSIEELNKIKKQCYLEGLSCLNIYCNNNMAKFEKVITANKKGQVMYYSMDEILE